MRRQRVEVGEAAGRDGTLPSRGIVRSIDRIDRKDIRDIKAQQIAVFHAGDLRSILVIAVG